ncbi:glutathione S-transferase LANCL1-like [Corticium candelabrum]|uniref:glutathione S-transferase LANCL1-like n=1 Tax=Corticium candelabrum TaxID=121492 RepID=UPI002E269369|nr:glutathione S-transferase LANCL1-like [Corticium candelabrum]
MVSTGFQWDDTRAFPNPFDDYKPSGSDGQITSDYASRLRSSIDKELKYIHSRYNPKHDRGRTVYTGSAGLALLYLRLSSVDEQYKGYLQAAADLLDDEATSRLTFLCGQAGPLALSAVLYSKLGSEDRMSRRVDKLLSLLKEIKEPGMPSEHLYGHVGYLYALLFVQHHLGKETISDVVIQQVCEVILNAGKEGACKAPEMKSPLMFSWHGKHYIGAAHGIGGIIYTLLEVSHLSPVQEHLQSHIRPTLDYLLTLKFKSNNFPSSISNSSDRLVQWCHGAPGLALTFSKAYEVFKDEQYLIAARDCADVTWQRGLLVNGYGLCHGVAGNAYAFLALYRVTKDPRCLYRAMKFGDWCMSSGDRQTRLPDRPFSLFEGLAGTIYFFCDLLEPLTAAFPAFAL